MLLRVIQENFGNIYLRCFASFHLCKVHINHLCQFQINITHIRETALLNLKHLSIFLIWALSLRWLHNECNGVSNHKPRDCLLSRLFRIRWNKISKLRVTGPWQGNLLADSEFPPQRSGNTKNVSISWRNRVEVSYGGNYSMPVL